MPRVGDEEVPGRIEGDATGRVQLPAAHHSGDARCVPRRGAAVRRLRRRRCAERNQPDQPRQRQEVSAHGAHHAGWGGGWLGRRAIVDGTPTAPTHGP